MTEAAGSDAQSIEKSPSKSKAMHERSVAF
jgi:hypothetical protein